MSLSQSVQGCLETTIGALGLPQASLDANLAKLEPRLASLREAYAKSTLPLLRVPEWRDDIAAARDALHKLTQGARTLVFFGTGGSSLGGQTLAQLGGWGIPGDDKHGSETRPRTRFYDNLDARTLELSLAGLDLKTSRFVVISKSGGTPETLVQVTAALDAVRKAGSPSASLSCSLPSPSPRRKERRTASARYANPSPSRRSTTIRISAAASPASPMSGSCRLWRAGSMRWRCARAPTP